MQPKKEAPKQTGDQAVSQRKRMAMGEALTGQKLSGSVPPVKKSV